MTPRLFLYSSLVLSVSSASFGQMNNHNMMNGSMNGSMGGSSADKAAFASVYDLLEQDLSARRQSGMLYGDPSSVNSAPPAPPIVEEPFVQAPLPEPLPTPPAVPAEDPFAQPSLPPLPQTADINPFDSDPFAADPFGDDSGLTIDQELGLDDDLASLPDLDEDEFDEPSPGLIGGLLGNIYIGAYGAATYAQPSSFENTAVAYDFKSVPQYGGGAMVGTKLGPINIEAEAHYSQTITEVENSTDQAAVPDGIQHVRTNLIGFANAFYKLKFGSFGAFAGGSAGYGQFNQIWEPTDGSVPSGETTAMGLVYGPLAGLTYAFGDKIELTAQYRYLLSGDLEYKDDTDAVISTEKITDHQAMFGVRYKF